MSACLNLLPSLLWRAVVWTTRQLLPSWLIGVESPRSHGSSRWARAGASLACRLGDTGGRRGVSTAAEPQGFLRKH
jgi:hypothetical protein